jgi:hypothetical protein
MKRKQLTEVTDRILKQHKLSATTAQNVHNDGWGWRQSGTPSTGHRRPLAITPQTPAFWRSYYRATPSGLGDGAL